MSGEDGFRVRVFPVARGGGGWGMGVGEGAAEFLSRSVSSKARVKISAARGRMTVNSFPALGSADLRGWGLGFRVSGLGFRVLHRVVEPFRACFNMA